MAQFPNMSQPFLWGAATSSHQVEGDNRLNDWWGWEKNGRVKECSGRACDHWNRYREDFELAQKLGHKAHRFSLEWSRLEPKDNHWDENALCHYKEVLRDLNERGIEPIVTLHHFTNPLWFQDYGGWLDERNITYYLRYVRKAVAAFGTNVRYWITLNEPIVYLYHSYILGTWPPGHKSFQDGLRVFRNLLLAHVKAYEIIHDDYQKRHLPAVWVSFAKHMAWLEPCRRCFMDVAVTRMRQWFLNDLMLEAATTGYLFFPGLFCEFLPHANSLDYIAVNYYTRHFIRWNQFSLLGLFGDGCVDEHHQRQIRAKNFLGWEIYAEGFYRILKRLVRYQLPIFVTENGVCTDYDQDRARFIAEHLAVIRKVRCEGVPVCGYLYWSLLDNFEWDKGFSPRFGIIGVDYQNFQRKIKDSAYVLTQSCRNITGE